MKHRIALYVLASVFIFTSSVFAQSLTVQVTDFDTASFPRVRASVSITDPSGHVLDTLGRESFRLTEDGQLAKISSVATSDAPLYVGLLIDRSGSMQMDNRWQDATTAADIFIDTMRAQDEAFITVFTTTVVTLQTFTSDHARLKNSIPRSSPAGDTAFYDAVYTSTLEFGARSDQRKNILIALTDGQDKASRKTFAQAVTEAQSAGVVVYAIALGKDADQTTLQRLASETGGKFYYAPTGEQLQDLYRQIAEVLQKEYAIDFESPRGIPDGTQRRVVLSVTLSGGQTLSGDGTYLAPALLGNAGMILPIASVGCGGLLLVVVAFGFGFVLARIRGQAALAMITLVVVGGFAILLLVLGVVFIWAIQPTALPTPIALKAFTVTPTIATPTSNVITITPTRTVTPTPSSAPQADSIDLAFTADMGNNVRRIYGLRQVLLDTGPKPGETPVLLTPAMNAWHPEILYGGRLIAFESAVNGVTQIFTMDANGKNISQLTSASKPSFQPAFSPDGKKIIFASEREGETKIFVMNIDGSNQRKLGEMPNYNFAPKISESLDWITFVSYRDGNAEIYLADHDGSNQRRLTNNTVEDEKPCFALSDQILFQSERSGHLEIYSMNPDGGSVRQLTRHPDGKDNFQPACSAWRFFAYAHIEGTMPHIIIHDMGAGKEWSVPHVGAQGELEPAWRR